ARRAELSKKWARKENYLFRDSYDLARVAQFVATVRDVPTAKDNFLDMFREIQPPDFAKADEPHRILASLKLPIYITTNYDDFLWRACESRVERDMSAKEEFCRWSEILNDEPTVFSESFRKPDPANPVIFHLYGQARTPLSLVLAEDDYLDFLVKITQE